MPSVRSLTIMIPPAAIRHLPVQYESVESSSHSYSTTILPKTICIPHENAYVPGCSALSFTVLGPAERSSVNPRSGDSTTCVQP